MASPISSHFKLPPSLQTNLPKPASPTTEVPPPAPTATELLAPSLCTTYINSLKAPSIRITKNLPLIKSEKDNIIALQEKEILVGRIKKYEHEMGECTGEILKLGEERKDLEIRLETVKKREGMLTSLLSDLLNLHQTLTTIRTHHYEQTIATSFAPKKDSTMSLAASRRQQYQHRSNRTSLQPKSYMGTHLNLGMENSPVAIGSNDDVGPTIVIETSP